MSAGQGAGPAPGKARPSRGLQVAAVLVTVWVLAAAASVSVLLTRADSTAGHGTAKGVTAAGPGSRAAGARSGTASTPAHRASSAPATTAGTISITDVGDMNFGMDGRYVPGGPADQLAAVAPMLHGDLTVGNLETALGSSGTTKCGHASVNCFAFQAPSSEALGLAQDGFSAVNVANNHTDDAGPAGEAQTDTALRDAHLAWTGRPGQITYLVRNGIRVALLGFAPYDYDSDLLDIPAAVAAVRQAAAHAQLVIVFIHAGAEGVTAQHVRPGMETYDGEERGDPIAFAHAVVNAGADLVLGSGPHVLRAMEWYHGKLIAYSLGNFAGYYTLGLNGVTADSAILRLRLRADGTFVAGSVTPIVLFGGGYPHRDLARNGIQLINALSVEDMGASGVRLGHAGRIFPPPVAAPLADSSAPTPVSTYSPLH